MRARGGRRARRERAGPADGDAPHSARFYFDIQTPAKHTSMAEENHAPARWLRHVPFTRSKASGSSISALLSFQHNHTGPGTTASVRGIENPRGGESPPSSAREMLPLAFPVKPRIPATEKSKGNKHELTTTFLPSLAGTERTIQELRTKLPSHDADCSHRDETDSCARCSNKKNGERSRTTAFSLGSS